MDGGGGGVDQSLFLLLNGWYPLGAIVWQALSDPRAAFVLVAYVVWAAYRTQRGSVVVVAAIAFAITDPFCGMVLKPQFAETRPCATLGRVWGPANIDGTTACGSGYAMPSAHAANTMAVAAVLASPPLVGVSVLVGLSRVVTGQHWPSDVAAGWGIGAVVGALVRWLFGRVKQ